MRIPRGFYLPLATATALASSATFAFAQTASDNFGKNASINVKDPGSSAKFSVLIGQIFTIFIWVAGVAAIFYLLISGFQYITAGGDGDKAAKARTGIVNAIIGIIILMAAFFIFRAATNVGNAAGTVGGSVNNAL